MQLPPMYSAVKVNGQPLYKAARQGLTVERKARPIEIYAIEYEGSPAPGEYTLTVRCSKGTYIRTLLEDIAALESLLLPVERVFEPLPLLEVDGRTAAHLYNGCPTSHYPAADGRYRVRDGAGQFLGLANIRGGVLRVEKLFVERSGPAR